MKNLLTPLIAATVLVAGASLSASDTKKDVTVNFHEPDNFTDVRSTFGGATDENYLDILATYLKTEAAGRLAPGQRLEVTFTDIDLAGDFIPTNAQMQDIRIIKDIYIPRQTLNFRLMGEDGKVLKEGERRLTDLNFMSNPRIIGRDEPLFYDKALLEDWLRKEFKS